MAEEKDKIRGDTPPKQPGQNVENEQISDIILILDKMELLIQAVSEINKDGKYKTVPADEKHKNSFLKVDKFSNMVENFLKNFWSQLKDPARFGIFSMKLFEMQNPENKQALKDLAEGKKTDAVAEFLKKYEIKHRNLDKQQSTNNKNDETMAKTTDQQMPENGNEQPRYRFNESMIDWKQLDHFGISKDFLQQKGLLDPLLKGYKTNTTIPISMNFGSVILRSDARLSLQQSQAGPVVLAIHGIRKEPELDRTYFGHNFSEEDKKNLRENGHLGRVVPLKMRNGEYADSFISVDKITNELAAMKVEHAFIPNEIKGVKLTEQEKNDLKEGKEIYLEGMKSFAGNDFNARVFFSAERRGIDFNYDNDKVFNRQTLGGVELTKNQIKALNEGKAILVEDMKRKDGELFSSYVKLNEASGRPVYTRYNPDTPEGAREIYVPKEMNGVPLTHEDREELRKGLPVFLDNMINRRNEEFSSYVKLDLETGIPMYSRTPDGFNERQEFKIPAEVWGVILNAQQRAHLQDGKAVLVEGMKGFDGNEFSQYVKANFNSGRLDYYNENPDMRRDATQRNVVEEAKEKRQEKKEEKKEENKQTNKRSRTRSAS